MGPPGVNDYGLRFPTKSNPLHTSSIFFSVAQWSVEKDDAMIDKKAKGKGKYRGKNGETGKCWC